MRTLAPALRALRRAHPEPRRLVVDAQRDAVGRDVAALVGGRERELVRAGREPGGRPGRRARSRRARASPRAAAPSTVSCTSPNVPASAERQRERDDAAHERVRSRASARRAAGAARSSRRRPAPKSVSAPGRADVERLRGEPVAHALRDAAGAAGGGDLAPQQRGRAADVRGRAGRAAAGVDRVRLRIARRDEDVRRRRDVGLEAAVVGRALGGVRLRQQRRRVERADRERAARVARRGGARGGDPRDRRRGPCGSRASGASSAACPTRRTAEVVRAPPRRARPAACRRAGSGSAVRPLDWIGSPVVLSQRGRRQRGVGEERDAVVAARVGGRPLPGEVAGRAARRRELEAERVAVAGRVEVAVGVGVAPRRPPSAGCGSCPPS